MHYCHRTGTIFSTTSSLALISGQLPYTCVRWIWCTCVLPFYITISAQKSNTNGINFFPFNSHYKLKADRPHPRDYSTHRQTPRTDNDSSLLFAALGKAEPLISTATRQKFDPDLWPWHVTLTPTFDLDPDLWP